MYYFGCKSKQEIGHFLYGKDLNNWSEKLSGLQRLLTNIGIDGHYAPKTTKKAGLANINYVQDMTILSFWDYSADKRGGSNSNFILEGKHSFDDMLKIAKQEYPSVFERFNFEIVEYEDK